MEDVSYIIGAFLSIILTTIVLITGNIICLFASLIIGAVTAFLWLFSSAGTKWHFITGIIALSLFISASVLVLYSTSEYSDNYSTFHDVYTVTAPFGVIWVDQEGSLSGGLFYSHGSLNSGLSESYIAKYMDGNQLKTVITNSSIIVDGNFTLEEITTKTYFQNSIWGWTTKPHFSTDWVIHLPSLPSVNQTTGDYLYVP